jgi:hypothetical protein
MSGTARATDRAPQRPCAISARSPLGPNQQQLTSVHGASRRHRVPVDELERGSQEIHVAALDEPHAVRRGILVWDREIQLEAAGYEADPRSLQLVTVS